MPLFLPPGFDQTIALEAADLVLDAYAQFNQDPKPSEAAPPAGPYQVLASLLASPKPAAPKELFGYVALNRDSSNVFVVIRGTNSFLDLIADADINQSEFPGWGQVHQGFYDVYRQFTGSIGFALDRVPADAPVYVTGHSLGASLAILAAAGISDLNRKPVTYAYASPRVSCWPDGFSAQFASKALTCWRIANTEDIVNNIPFATLNVEGAGGNDLLKLVLSRLARLDFTHVGVEVPHTMQRGSVVDNHSMAKYRETIANGNPAA